MNPQELIEKTKEGFKTLSIENKYKEAALIFLEQWLTDEQYKDYVPQIEYMIGAEKWDLILDSFYQIIPFGTAGRRGLVGIGPNRINPWTINSSAQGHSQYLIKAFGEEAKKRGIVLAYDVREYRQKGVYNDEILNPVKNLKCVDLAKASAAVYAANGLKVYFFEDVRTTPELSFTIRFLDTVSGAMFSASHNPPEHNGIKVFDSNGGQLLPPYDQELVDEVTNNTSEIKTIDFEEAKQQGLIEIIGEKIDREYVEATKKLSYSKDRNIKIVYTPLHGPGTQSVYASMKELGFDITLDPKTSNLSGAFEGVTFNIPNPEVPQSFDSARSFADEIGGDIILNSDPDADRIGIEVKHNGKWQFLTGNEIAIITTNYAIEKRKELEGELNSDYTFLKTLVSSDLTKVIAEKNNITVIGDLLVGYKYIAEQMNRMEKEGKIDKFIYGFEESHGYTAGSHLREKDAAIPAIWLAEAAAEQKTLGKTLVDYLNEIYEKYGYFLNYLTEVRILGAEGMSQIQKIQDDLRNNPPKSFGDFEVVKVDDKYKGDPFVSESDKGNRNVVIFYFKPLPGTQSIKVTSRPSGTEPKMKMYFEIGSEPGELEHAKKICLEIKGNLEKAFMNYCYKILGIDFPDRGYLLFVQLPLKDKMRYFEIEPEIEALKDVSDQTERQQKLDTLLSFLGVDPIQKVDAAFTAKNKVGIKEYLNL